MRHPSRSHLIITLAALIGLAVVAGIIVLARFRALSAHPERLIGPQLARVLGRQVTVGRAHASFNGRVVLEDVKIADGATLKQGVLLSVPRMVAQIDLLGAALRGVPLPQAIRWLRLDRPHLRLVRGPTGVWNVASLAGKAGAGRGFQLQTQVTFADATVDISDFRANITPLPAHNRLVGVSGSMSPLPNGVLGFSVTGQGTAGRLATLKLTGTYAPSRYLAQVQARAAGANLPYWTAYLRNTPWARVVAGRADADLSVAILHGAMDLPSLTAQIAFHGAAATTPALRAPIHAANGTVRYGQDQLYYTSQGASDGLSFHSDGTVTGFRQPQIDLAFTSTNVDWSLLPGLLRAWPPRMPLHPSGRGVIDFHVIGPVRAPTMSGTVRAPVVAAFGETARDVTLYGDFRAGTARIQRGSAQVAGGSVSIQGEASVAHHATTFDVHGGFRGVSLAALRRPGLPATQGLAGGTYSVAGSPSAWHGQVGAAVTSVAAAGLRVARGSVQAATTDGRHWTAAFQAAGGSVAAGSGAVPFESVRANVTTGPGRVAIQSLSARALGGVLTASGQVMGAGRLRLAVSANGVSLASALRPFGRRSLAGAANLRGTVTGSFHAPHFSGNVTILNGIVQTGTGAGRGQPGVRSLAFDRLSGTLAATPAGLDIRQAVVQAQGARATLSGTVALIRHQQPQLNLNAQVSDIPLAAAARLIGVRQPISGHVTASLSIRGSPSAVQLSGPVHLTNVQIQGVTISDAQASLQSSGRRTLIQGARATVDGAPFTAAGALGPGNALSIDVRGDSVPLDRFSAPLAAYATVSGSADVRIHAGGTLAQPIVAGSLASASPINVNGQPLGALTAGVSWHAGELSVQNLSMRSGAATAQIARMGFNPTTKTFSADGSLTGVPITVLLRIAQNSPYVRTRPDAPLALQLARISKPVGGNVSGTFQVAGLVNALSGPFQLQVSAPELGRIQATSLSAQGQMAAGRLLVQPAHLLAPGLDLTVTADLTRPQDQRFTLIAQQSSLPALWTLARELPLDATPAGRRFLSTLDRLPPPTQGLVQNITLTLSGPSQNRTGALQFQASGVVLKDQPIDTVSGTFTLENGTAHVDRFIARSRSAQVVINKGTVGNTGDILLDVTANNIDLGLMASLAGLRVQVHGLADLNALVSGNAASPTLVATLDSSDATIGPEAGMVLAVRANVQNGRLNVDSLRIAHGGGSELDATGSLPFNWQPLGIPRSQPLSLALSFNAAPDLESALMAAAGGPLAVPGGLNPGGAAAAALFAGLSSEIKSITGSITGRITVGGSLAHPTAAGPIQISGGGIQLATLRNPLQDIHGTLQFLNDHLEITSLTGQSAGGGNFAVTGTASLKKFPQGPAKVRLVLSNLNVDEQNATGIYGERITRSALNGTMMLAGPLRSIALGGQVTVSSAIINVPANPPKNPKAAVPALPNLPLSGLSIVVGPNVEVTRGGMQAVISGSMIANGTIANPNIDGKLTVDRGHATFFRRFDISPGSFAKFVYQPPNPTRTDLDITVATRIQAASPFGQGQVQTYKVTLSITGTMDNPSIETYSTPPGLDQQEILAALGYTADLEALLQGRNVNRVFQQELASALTGAVFPQLLTGMEDSIARSLGLEEVSLTFDSGTAARIQVTKHVAGPVYVTYERMLTGPSETYLYKLAYRMTQTFQIGFTLDDRGTRTLTIEGRMRF